MHGLRSDTNRLMQAQEEDFQRLVICRFYDAQLLNAVLQANRSKPVMDVIERSLKTASCKITFPLPELATSMTTEMPSPAADFSNRRKRSSLVHGIVHDEDEELEVVIGSLRTTKLTLDPDDSLKKPLGKIARALFWRWSYRSGGFETRWVSCPAPMRILPAKIKWEVFDAQIKQKLLRLQSERQPVPTE